MNPNIIARAMARAEIRDTQSRHFAAERAPCDHTEGPHHDCAYVDARNRLIMSAARHADTVCTLPEIEPPGFVERSNGASWYSVRWTREFHAAMNRLWSDKEFDSPHYGHESE